MRQKAQVSSKSNRQKTAVIYRYYNYFLTLVPPKKLLSIFTTKSGCSSGIQCPDRGTLIPGDDCCKNYLNRPSKVAS
jgi:hypothetical protein